MTSILLVEDEQSKREQISRALTEAGVSLETIDVAADAFTAKRLLSRRRYTLLILDINIPARPDAPSAEGGGLEVLQSMRASTRVMAPEFIIGLTAYESGRKAAGEQFGASLWKVISYSPWEDSWKKTLQGALAEIRQRSGPPFPSDGSTHYTDIAVFAALPEELAPLLELDLGWTPTNVPHDPQQYWSGSIPGPQQISLVAAASPRMGLPTAAVVCSKMIAAFRPRLIAVVGICAGFRDRTKIGDLLVSEVCWDWGSGKWVEQRDADPLFKPAPYQWTLDADLRAQLTKAHVTGPILDRLHNEYTGVKPSSVPSLLVNATASGGSVLQSQGHMDSVLRQHKNIVGIDMEAYSVFTAASMADSPRPKCLAIKSVCDFGDGAKDDDFHPYAAYLSATFLIEFCRTSLPAS